MKNKLLVVHGGGPTAVLNASLYGIIQATKNSELIDEVYGAIGGVGAIFKRHFKNLAVEDYKLERLLSTPATAIGSSRYPLYEDDYIKMATILKQEGFTHCIMSGGNGTMDTCRKLDKACKNDGILVIGVPKTMDNDLMGIDHAPGFPSAANYMVEVTKEIIQDVRSLPIHICIIEAMGRNAGWVTAATSVAKPDFIYLPERPFNEEKFLSDVKAAWDRKQGLVIVVSEGLVDDTGESIVPPIFKTQRAVYYGDVGTYLATLIIKRLGIKARAEKPGLAGRASIALRSEVDIKEAIQVGIKAVEALEKGQSGYMVGLKRISNVPYQVDYPMIDLENFNLSEKTLEDRFINKEGNGINNEYIEWIKPLLNEDENTYYDFLEDIN